LVEKILSVSIRNWFNKLVLLKLFILNLNNKFLDKLVFKRLRILDLKGRIKIKYLKSFKIRSRINKTPQSIKLRNSFYWINLN